jgi:hypothetical protein
MVTKTNTAIRVDGDGFVKSSEIMMLDLYIVVYPEERTFRIYKNRWGYAGDNEFPLALLPKVLERPDGTPTFGWETE